jgi:hypothetical protein
VGERFEALTCSLAGHAELGADLCVGEIPKMLRCLHRESPSFGSIMVKYFSRAGIA